ncbi:hypothetical protein H5410_041496 [Solanum commersonii]|uniref:Uncharacterized protein n=1 Tax=Solanum commersonii TaxID=4109 RepID=A0A9J5XVP3_SOLCO|nr:hypothetical protein H5410_041496 [Solanum commersonii]
MAPKTRGGIVKRFVSKPSKNKKISKPSKNKKTKAEEVSRSSKKKEIVVEEPKSNSDSDTMAKIDNYEDISAQATDDVESSEEKTGSGDEESSRERRDTGDEDDDPLSLSTCAREISVKYLKNKINLKKQSEVYKERGMHRMLCIASTGHFWFGYMRLFLILVIMQRSPWILLCQFLVYLDGTRQRAIILSKVVHPYLIPTVRETKQNYMETLKPYTDKVKDTIIDALKANLKGVTVLTSLVENEEDEILEEKLEENEEETEEKLEEKKQEEKGEEQIEENKEEEKKEEHIEENKEEEKKEEQIKEKEEEQKEEEKIEENKEQEKEEEQIELQEEEEKEQEKLEEKVYEGLAEERKEGSDENSVDMMGIVMELNGELNGDE